MSNNIHIWITKLKICRRYWKYTAQCGISSTNKKQSHAYWIERIQNCGRKMYTRIILTRILVIIVVAQTVITVTSIITIITIILIWITIKIRMVRLIRFQDQIIMQLMGAGRRITLFFYLITPILIVLLLPTILIRQVTVTFITSVIMQIIPILTARTLQVPKWCLKNKKLPKVKWSSSRIQTSKVT